MIPQRVGGHLGWARGACGAFLGIAVAAVVTALLLGTNESNIPLLVAPLGASAVLVFAVPASPLAQPWPVIGGDLISAAIGFTIGHLLGIPWLAAAFAVGLAIAVMSVCRCLHPPGGACALLYALGTASSEAWNWSMLGVITANVLALTVVGWIYNNLTGHSWPHRSVQPPHSAAPSAPLRDYTQEDLEAVLADWNDVVDIDVNDLDAIYQALIRRLAR